MKERTLIILKPDAVKRGLTGKVIDRLESKGLKLVASKMKTLDEDVLKEHYSHLADKPFFPSILSFMTSSPVILQIWEGTEAIEVARLTLGVTNARQAQPGTVRGDFAMSVERNIAHASENEEKAKEEIQRFFDESEIHNYKRLEDDVLYSDKEK